MRSLFIATLLATVSTGAFAETQNTCSLEGLTGWPHPSDLGSMPFAEWPKPQGGEICKVTGASIHAVGDKTYRFSFATINRSGASEHIGAFLTISRVEQDKETRLGRFVIPLERVDSNSALQIREHEGRIFASSSRKEPELFAIGEDSVRRLPNAGWYGQLIRFLPPKDAIGQILAFDLHAMSALVAVHEARADDPARPASAFAPPRAIQVDLEWQAGELAVKAQREISGRQVQGPDVDEDESSQRQAISKRIGALPSGTEMCWLSAYSIDKDPKGLNVRSKPAGNAPILGQLSPPLKDPDIGETLAKEVTIIGYRDGWFLIDTRIDEDDPKGSSSAKSVRKRWFEGRGWVNARMLGARTAHSGLGEHKLFAAPTPNAHWTVGRQKDGDPMNGDSEVARIHACSFDWALVDSEGGQRGWRRRLCSNQLTTCP